METFAYSLCAEAQIVRKVSLLAEVHAPLRTARLLLLYPSALVWAAIASLDAQLRAARALLQGEAAPAEAAAAVGVAAAVAALAVWARREDQRAAAASMVEIATRAPELEPERRARGRGGEGRGEERSASVALMYKVRNRYPLHYIVFKQVASHLCHEGVTERVFSTAGNLSDENGRMDPYRLGVWTSIGKNKSVFKPKVSEILTRYFAKYGKEKISASSE
ncbi:hypothetical protein AB1Y20_014754 [Prymnesium parvum]|uniref:Uncharacterized protein n=1 Tax=Prymnesium parvum TaxID=97485 RepID=A0AB34IE84_PRYPA